ncbi:MAG TPA: hypothetical protein VFM18_17175 [Methanosarcina sp.]|nr:hypothetical protein [Methanosarcina sp.]
MIESDYTKLGVFVETYLAAWRDSGKSDLTDNEAVEWARDEFGVQIYYNEKKRIITKIEIIDEQKYALFILKYFKST